MSELTRRHADAFAPAFRLPADAGPRPCRDPRWPAIVAILQTLRLRGRRSLRVVDADCGAGGLLLHVLRHARLMGFTAIEGRGLCASSALAARARIAAGRAPDPAIGVAFEAADRGAALQEERELPADILLWHEARDGEAGIEAALRLAADAVVGDHAAMARVA